MSSIWGLINNYNSEEISDSEIKGITAWNLAYGKDAIDSYRNNDFAIGCCLERLNQNIDINTGVIDNNSCNVVIDALLYNREDLLQACTIPNIVSDEKLLLSYLESNGLDALSRVNGDFAGAIYNPQKKELILFRDHMGVRPLFYYYNDSFIAFSTDIRSILGILRANITLREDWIYETLSGFGSDDTETTEYENVFCVKPGHYYSFSLNNNKIELSQKAYWTPGNKKIRYSNDKKYQARLKELITDSVKRRLDIVTGNIGAELSGGLDSGVIDILINRLGKKCTYFSWSSSPEKVPLVDKDERLIINDICSQEKITCSYPHAFPGIGSVIENNIKNVGLEINTDDSDIINFAFPAYINTTKICETSLFMNHSKVKAVFTGHGGDEGVSHRANPYELVVFHEYYHYLRFMFSTTHGKPHRIINTIKRIKKNIKDSKNYLRTAFQSSTNADELILASFRAKYSKVKMPPLFFAYDPIKYIKHGGSRNRLDNVALQGAYCNVRYLAPYVDHRLIDFALSIPRYQYLRGRKNRFIFREAFKDIMPLSLYKVTEKEDASSKSIKPDPNWFEAFQKWKFDVISLLKKEKWGHYIDFEKLEAFKNKGKPEDDDIYKDMMTLSALNICSMAQNALDKSREVSFKLLHS